MKFVVKLTVLVTTFSLCDCQSDGASIISGVFSDGAFWWKNKNLLRDASQSRGLKDETAKIRTLPPKYRHEDGTTTGYSVFGDDSEEEKDHANYKYNNEPDCVCVPKYLCNQDNILITDGAGIINERSTLCGNMNVCCRLPRVSTPIAQKTSTTTTRKPYFNFNLNNITSIISTILEPSTNLKCTSRKGNKLQERVLIHINEDGEEEEEGENKLTGVTAFLEYPWMLELLKKNLQKKRFEYKCGAVLISSNSALTANHCLKSKIHSNFIIRAGDWDRATTLEYAPHQDRVVNSIMSHENYYSGGLYYDIAILKFEMLKLDVNVQPLCLPDEDQLIPPKIYCTVTAWGSTNASEKKRTTDKLRFVKVPIVDHSTCERQFQNTRVGSHFKLHPSFMCAGGEEGLDSCQNDGGSPLVCSNGDSFYLYGLVSWGLSCGEKDVPGVYTNIQYLVSWIKSHM